MTTEFLKNKSKSERINILSANAQQRIPFDYLKPLTEDQLNEFKEAYFASMSALDSAKKKLDHAKEVFKIESAIPAADAKTAYDIIKEKAISIQEEVYLIPNYETLMIDYVNDQGEVVFNRRMLPGEKQIMMKVSNE